MAEGGKLMAGKRGVVFGVANNRSIAWGIARACRDRVALRGRPGRMLCRRCGVEFAVAWEEHYLAQAL